MENLAIVLEYAYRGIAAQKAQCHTNRFAGCPICDALSDAEAELLRNRVDLPEQVWWTTRRERLTRWIPRRPRRRGEGPTG